jgi:hypothetical protein
MLALAVSGCWGPLDRRDGALSIELVELPPSTNAIEVTVHAGGRAFSERIARPPGDVIDSFSAIPAGAARIDARAFEDTRPLTSRRNVPIEVVEGKTTTVRIGFSAGPEVRVLSPDDGARFHISDGAIEVVVEAIDPLLPTDLAIRIGDRALPAVASAGARWTANIDPLEAAPILPAELTIDIEACAAGDRAACTSHTRKVLVERRAWKKQLAAVARARPAFSAFAGGTIVFGDREGMFHIFALATGEPRYAGVMLNAPLTRATVIADDLAITVDGAGVLHGFALATGLESFALALGAPRPTSPVFDGRRILVGAGRRLLAIDHLSETVRELAVFTATITAAPWADERGVIAADSSGQVMFLDASDRVEAIETLPRGAIVPPIREGAGALIADESGLVHRVRTAGEPVMLSPPPVHPPVRAGEAIVYAFGDRLAWIRPDRVTIREAGGPITGAPASWPSGQAVVIGIQQPSLVKAADEEGRAKVISRIEGAPLPALLIEGPTRLVVPSNTGSLEMFELEEGFF